MRVAATVLLALGAMVMTPTAPGEADVLVPGKGSYATTDVGSPFDDGTAAPVVTLPDPEDGREVDVQALEQTLRARRASTSWSVDGFFALPTGTYTARSEQPDTAGPTGGNRGLRSASTSTINAIPPAVTLTQPSNNSSRVETTPIYAGQAGDRPGDSATITVREWAGSPSGPELRVHTATRSGSTWSVAGVPLAPGVYSARAEQTDSAGNTGLSTVNTFQIETLACGGDADCDGDDDRYQTTVDCNDKNPAINPGAIDIPGNKIDEDCKDGPAPYPRLDSTFLYEYRFVGRFTVFTQLYLRRVQAGSTIRITCTGRGCPFRLKTQKVTKSTRRRNLSARLRRARLAAGTRLEIRVTKPGTIGPVRRLIVRRNRRPTQTDLCFKPGAKLPVRCD